MIQMNYLQNRKRHTDLENEFMVARGEGSRKGIVREFGTDMYTLLSLKWITNKALSRAAWMCGQFAGEWIYVYVWLSSFTVHVKLSHIVNWLYPNTK